MESMRMKKPKLKQAAKLVGGIAGLLVIMLWVSGALRDRQSPGTIATEPGTPLPADAVLTTARRAANMAGDAATWWASYPGREVTVEDLVATVYRWIDFQEVTT